MKGTREEAAHFPESSDIQTAGWADRLADIWLRVWDESAGVRSTDCPLGCRLATPGGRLQMSRDAGRLTAWADGAAP